MNDLTKLSRHEQTTAKVLPSVGKKLREARELIASARAMSADLVNIEDLRKNLSTAYAETNGSIYVIEELLDRLIRKACS